MVGLNTGDELKALCHLSGCEQWHPKDRICDWIADQAGRRCRACYEEHLARRDLPPAEICELRRRVDRGEFEEGSKAV